jgi:hypothetical protein
MDIALPSSFLRGVTGDHLVALSRRDLPLALVALSGILLMCRCAYLILESVFLLHLLSLISACHAALSTRTLLSFKDKQPELVLRLLLMSI